MLSWDDRRFLVDFEPVGRISLESLERIWTEQHFQAWHPLHLMSYWIDVPWAGPDPVVLHAVNAVMWALALVLLLAVFERLGVPRWAAVLGTLAYGLHPVQVEAVTWATGRKEIVALILACGVMLMHLRSERPFDRPSWISRGLYVLAAMAKTTVLPLPGLLFLIDVWIRRLPWKQALLRQAPALVIGLAFGALVMSIWEQHEMIRPVAAGAAGQASTGTAGLVAASYTHYLLTALWPATTAPVYAIYRAGDIGLSAWLGPVALAALFTLAWRARAPRAKLSIAGFALMLLPVSNLIPVYFQFQDRYLSLPLLTLGFGFAAAAAWAVGRIDSARWRWGALTVAAALVALLAGRTVQYQEAWSGDLRLWRHTVATHPDAFYARMKVGELLRDEGRLDEALGVYEGAIAVAPDLRLGHAARFNVIAMRDEERFDLSARSLSFAQRYHAHMEDPAALRDLAGEMASEGYREASLVALGRALDLDPVGDERLENAAASRVRSEELWLARFYLSRMSRPPLVPALRPLYAEVHGATPEEIRDALNALRNAAPASP